MSKIRLIDATAFSERCESLKSGNKFTDGYLVYVQRMIDQQPTLSLKEAKKETKAEWIKEGRLCRCSSCGDLWGIVHGFKYCPTCGAKMKGVF